MDLAGRLRPRRTAAALAVVCATVGAGASADARASASSAAPPATVVSVSRSPLPQGDRIVIELSREVIYLGHRIGGPDRVFLDFRDSTPGPSVVDQIGDIAGLFVKGVRVGRHINGVTRVVLDLDGQPRYRAFTLPNPFRVVIDLESASTAAWARDAAVLEPPIAPRFDPTPEIEGARPPAMSTPKVMANASALSTFVLERSAGDHPAAFIAPSIRVSTIQPRQMESLSATIGLGYVQGADWGSEIRVFGSAAGVQALVDGQITKGAAGLALEHGSMTLFDPDRAWRVEAGDVFSYLRGASRGARVSYPSFGGRRPTLAILGSRAGLADRPTVLTYRDQVQWRSQTLLDAEIATDRSYLLRSRLAVGRFDAEISYRTMGRGEDRLIERGAALGVRLGRGLFAQLNGFRFDDASGRTDWLSAGVRVPIARWFMLGLERTYAATGSSTTVGSAALAGFSSGHLNVSHRYQWGRTDVLFGDASRSIAREQLQTMASWTTGPRLNATLQTVTAWNDRGRAQRWEEIQTSVVLTRTTSVNLAAAVPDVRDTSRLRVRVVQRLPRQFSIAAEFGRVSPFQLLAGDVDRPRVRLMVSRLLNVATPARGGEVSGRVVDHAGHPVAGTRVTLGPYAASTDVAGRFVFRPLPRGTYELALDDEFLPASYAWNGHRVSLDVGPQSRITADLGVTPLNAIHGRAFVDRNTNGRFDAGEAMAGVVIRLGDRVTASNASGEFSFFNVWPGHYDVELDTARLPDELIATGPTRVELTLGDGVPATGVDFVLAPKVKPIIWKRVDK